MARSIPVTRRFTLADLMILVVATGLGLALLRPYLEAFNRPGMVWSPATRAIETTYGVWSPIAAWWMIALILIQYGGPHPRRARLIRRPGHVACCVAAVALGWGLVHAIAGYASRDLNGSPFSFQQFWITISVPVGPAVEGAWLVLALSGRWRADPGWVDRLGRFLGCLWIGWSLFWLIPSPIRQQIPPFWDGVLT